MRFARRRFAARGRLGLTRATPILQPFAGHDALVRRSASDADRARVRVPSARHHGSHPSRWLSCLCLSWGGTSSLPPRKRTGCVRSAANVEHRHWPRKNTSAGKPDARKMFLVCVNYFPRRLQAMPANPIKPVPNNKSVEGSGTPPRPSAPAYPVEPVPVGNTWVAK